MSLIVDWENPHLGNKGDAEEDVARICIVGDWCPAFGGTERDLVRAGQGFYSALNDYLQNSDLNVVNMEMTLTLKGASPPPGPRVSLDSPETLDTLRDCDVIYVVNKGRVVQQGSFSELAAQKGSLFATMCQAQRL